VTEGVEALLLRGDELAKGWLLALVRTELARTDLDLLADAGERLSLVAELVRAAVLRRRAESEPRGAPRPRVPSLRVARTDVPSSAREGGDFENGGAPDQGIGAPLTVSVGLPDRRGRAHEVRGRGERNRDRHRRAR
jgi:hypothetical protein